MLLPCITVSNNIVAKIINYFDFLKKKVFLLYLKNIVAEYFVDLLFLSLDFLALNMRGSSGKAGVIENFILKNGFSFLLHNWIIEQGKCALESFRFSGSNVFSLAILWPVSFPWTYSR